MTVWDARTGWLDATQRAADHRTGLAPYYPFLYACALGLKAQRVLEFGAGESSHVLANAMQVTGGTLVSVAPEFPSGYEHRLSQRWHHELALSCAAYSKLPGWGPYDLVLHDGSHSADVVSADLVAALPSVRPGGLVLVHDVGHSYVGPAMRRGVVDMLWKKEGIGIDMLVLPFAFGLLVIQVTGATAGGLAPVDPTGLDKPTSAHKSELREITV